MTENPLSTAEPWDLVKQVVQELQARVHCPPVSAK